MGEHADDAYDRAIDEWMARDHMDEYGDWYFNTRYRPRQRPAPTTTPDDFDVLE